MADLLHGWPDTSQSARRPPAQVNPLRARKPSARAKYGWTPEKERELVKARQRAPPVLRPRPLRPPQYFRELIHKATHPPVAEIPERQNPRAAQESPAPSEPPAAAAAAAHPALEQSPTRRGPPQEPSQVLPAPSILEGTADTTTFTDGAAAEETQNPGFESPMALARLPPSSDWSNASLDPHPEPNPDPHSPPPDPEAFGGPAPPPSVPSHSPGYSRHHHCSRRRKLFSDSLDGPHPRTTGKIVARLAACRSWRRPLASRLLPRFLPLFDEHAAAYFFKHVPTLQPKPAASGAAAPAIVIPGVTPPASHPGAGSGSAGPSSAFLRREAADFRIMVVAVCCSLLPKLPTFGPRALCLMVAGLGRMGICHSATLQAWETRAVSQLGLMRPDQLIASLEGLAAVKAGQVKRRRRHARQASNTAASPDLRVGRGAKTIGTVVGWRKEKTAATETHGSVGRPNRRPAAPTAPAMIGATLQEAVFAAAASALPCMTVAEAGRLLQAMAKLQLAPPSALLDSACTRVRHAIMEEADRLAAEAMRRDGLGSSTGPGGDGGAGDGAGSGPDGGALLRLARALAQEEANAGPSAPYLPRRRADAGGGETGARGTSKCIGKGASSARSGGGGKGGGTAGSASAGGEVATAAASSAVSSAARVAVREQPEAADTIQLGAAPEPPLRPIIPQDPLCGRDLSRVVAGLGALRYQPPAEWLTWLFESTTAVMAAQVGFPGASRGGDLRRGAAVRRRMGETAQRRMQPTRSAAEGGESSTGRAQSPTGGSDDATAPVLRFFMAEDLAEFAVGMADLFQTRVPEAAAAAVVGSPPALAHPSSPCSAEGPTSAVRLKEGDGGRAAPSSAANDGCQPVAASTPASEGLPRRWFDLVCDAALYDIRSRLDPAAAARVAAAAAAAVPIAVLLQGDVTQTERAAVVATANTVAAAASSAAEVVPAATSLMTALLRVVRLKYTPPAAWCTAVAEVGLDLVSYMPPQALLTWLHAFAAWGAPRPLPLAWIAAAAVTSRSSLASYTAVQLCQLPVALAAAGARLTSAWAAAYLRQLAEGLSREAVTDVGPNATTVTVPSRRRHGPRAVQSKAPDIESAQDVGSGTVAPLRGVRNLGRRSAPRRRWAGAEAAGPDRRVLPLPDVAAALAAMVVVVPDLGYAAEVEPAAMEALARTFGLVAHHPPPPQLQPQHPQETPSPATASATLGWRLQPRDVEAVTAFFSAAGRPVTLQRGGL